MPEVKWTKISDIRLRRSDVDHDSYFDKDVDEDPYEIQKQVGLPRELEVVGRVGVRACVKVQRLTACIARG